MDVAKIERKLSKLQKLTMGEHQEEMYGRRQIQKIHSGKRTVAVYDPTYSEREEKRRDREDSNVVDYLYLRLMVERKTKGKLYMSTHNHTKHWSHFGFQLVSIALTINELKKDIRRNKPDVLVIGTEAALEIKNYLLYIKKKYNMKIIAILPKKNIGYMTRGMIPVEKAQPYNYTGPLIDAAIENTTDDEIGPVFRNLNFDKKNQAIEQYLYDIFPNIPAEALDNLIKQINHEIKHINPLTDTTYAGGVGAITFKLNGRHYVFKVYTKGQHHNAKVEFKVGQHINKDDQLKHVCPEFMISEHQHGPIEYKGYYLLLTEDIRHKHITPVTGTEQNLTSTFLSMTSGKTHINYELVHKIYVIALVHARLKKYLKHEEIKQIQKRKDFFSFSQIKAQIEQHIPEAAKYLKELKHVYNDIKRKHSNMDESVIAHNDPKWDNFVGGYLIDFGSVHSATPYNDLARVLLFEAYRHDFRLEGYISAYIFFRIHLDPSYKHTADLQSHYHNIYVNTYERILTESLRIARAKSVIGENHIAQEAIMVAATLAKKLHDNDFKQLVKGVKHQTLPRMLSAKEEFQEMEHKDRAA